MTNETFESLSELALQGLFLTDFAIIRISDSIPLELYVALSSEANLSPDNYIYKTLKFVD